MRIYQPGNQTPYQMPPPQQSYTPQQFLNPSAPPQPSAQGVYGVPFGSQGGVYAVGSPNHMMQAGMISQGATGPPPLQVWRPPGWSDQQIIDSFISQGYNGQQIMAAMTPPDRHTQPDWPSQASGTSQQGSQQAPQQPQAPQGQQAPQVPASQASSGGPLVTPRGPKTPGISSGRRFYQGSVTGSAQRPEDRYSRKRKTLYA